MATLRAFVDPAGQFGGSPRLNHSHDTTARSAGWIGSMRWDGPGRRVDRVALAPATCHPILGHGVARWLEVVPGGWRIPRVRRPTPHMLAARRRSHGTFGRPVLRQGQRERRDEENLPAESHQTTSEARLSIAHEDQGGACRPEAQTRQGTQATRCNGVVEVGVQQRCCWTR